MNIFCRIRSSLSTKLTMFLLVCLLVCLGILTSVITTNVTKTMVKEQSDKLTLMAQHNATLAKESIERVVNKQTTLVSAVQSISAVPSDYQLSYVQTVMTQFNKSEDDTLASYYIMLPSAASAAGVTVYSTQSKNGADRSYTTMLTAEQVKSATSSANFSVIDPYYKTIDGTERHIMTVASPIADASGKVMGLVCSDIDITLVNNVDYSNGDYDSFYNLIICGHQTVISHTKAAEAIGQKYLNVATSVDPQLILDTAANATATTIATTFLDRSTDGSAYYRACVPFYVGTSKTVWLSATSVLEGDFMAPVITQLIVVIVISLATMIVLGLIIFFSLRRAIQPICEMQVAASELAKGNLHIEINHRGDDEIGSLAESLRTSTAVIRAYIADIDRAMGEMSGGNFDLAPSEPFIGDFAGIEQSISRFIVSMSNAMYRVNATSVFVSSSSHQLACSAQLLADGASEQAAGIEELSSTIAQIATQVNTNARNAKDAMRETANTGSQLEASNAKMHQMTAAMDEISQKSAEIGKIIKTIDDIAFQTNILALNAAVEAARAGAAGKGFAVVADEVRNLASKSAEAAANTTVLIEETVRAVKNGTNILDDTATALLGVVEGAQRVTTLIDDISCATGAQAVAVSEVNIGVEGISQVVQQNSATSEESAATAQELNSQADILQELVGRFHIKESVVTK